jgi:ATP-dependent Clp protease adaptor protein ClpS
MSQTDRPDEKDQRKRKRSPDDNDAAGGAANSTAVKPKRRRATRGKGRRKSRMLPPYHVVLLDDDDHSYEYVIEMLKCLFGYPDEQGYQIAGEVDVAGRAVVATTHKELAELKRDQIRGYGVDVRVATCAGSMTAIIEPADAGK